MRNKWIRVKDQQMELNLNLKSYISKLRIHGEEKKLVYDPVRRRYVHLSPEELVRQAVLCFLMDEKGVPRSRIAVEKQILVNGQKKRFDLLIFDHAAQPLMIVEVKSFQVRIDQSTADQVGWYNFKLQAPFLLITNGEQSFAFEAEFASQSTKMLAKFPL